MNGHTESMIELSIDLRKALEAKGTTDYEFLKADYDSRQSMGGHTFEQVMSLVTWAHHGWPVVRLSVDLGSQFAETEPPRIVATDNYETLAIEVGESTTYIVGFVSLRDAEPDDVVRLVRNVYIARVLELLRGWGDEKPPK